MIDDSINICCNLYDIYHLYVFVDEKKEKDSKDSIAWSVGPGFVRHSNSPPKVRHSSVPEAG